MIHSIATVSLSGTLREKIAAIAGAGFRGIEIFEADLILHDGPVPEIRAMIADHGLEVVAYQPFRDFEGLPGPLRARAFDRAKRKLDIMDGLGAGLLMVCSSVSPHAIGGIRRAADDFAELGALAGSGGMRVAYEALAWGTHVHDYRDSWEIVRRAAHPAVGLCLDTFHIFSRGTDIGAIAAIPGDRIFLVQAADAPRLSMDHLSWSRHFRCFPGQGELPLGDFMGHLAQTGYDGPLSLEIFNDQFRAGSVEATARDGYRSLVFLRGRTEDGGDAGLPPARPPAGVGFIEFALAGDDVADFTRLIGALGFTRSGRHRRKAVEHWRQGGVNLVINLEPGSFAQRHRDAHGPSVCAVGLEVGDVGPAVERAGKLGYPASHGDPETDTHGMPAVTGLGGSLLYFVGSHALPSLWTREFAAEEAATPMAHLVRVDHIAFTMTYEEMLAATLMHRAMFAMEASSGFDVADPGGLVRSQVMQTPDQAVCFTFNSSEAPNTLSSRLLAEYAGTGVQHIALATTDIFATAAALREAGVRTMPVPANYYDDLSARFAIPEEEAARMRDNNILYCEDEDGSFRQLYTRHFRRRFCFEVVERNGYRGYGAPNAPVRTAMQAREWAAADGQPGPAPGAARRLTPGDASS